MFRFARPHEANEKSRPIDDRSGIANRPILFLFIPCFNIAINLGRFELCLQVADIERSLGFHTKLGFHPVAGGAEHGVIVIRSGDCRIGLYQGHIAENLLNFRGGNIAEIARQAEASGLEFEKPPSVGGDGSTGALLRDPDGNAVYFVSHPEEQGP